VKKFNPLTLPYMAAIAQALQFAHAGYVYIGWIGAIIGTAVGVTVSFSVATAASRISDISQKRKALGYVSLITLLLISPAMIAPAAWLSFGSIPVPWARILAAVVWAAAPDLAIVLSGAIAGKSLVQSDKPAAVVTVKAKPARKMAVNHVSKAELVAYLQDNPGATNAAVARHFDVSRQAIASRRESILEEIAEGKN
jgi:hypothetical protein